MTTSPNMNLQIPSVGVTLGPQYAVDVNNSLLLVDEHDHSPGYGVPVTPSGLNINATLSMQSNNLTVVRTVRFDPFSSPSFPSEPSDLGCLSVIDDDLYYTDEVGNLVRLTENGNVAGTPGSISGLVSPASASFVSGTGTFVFQSNTNTAANMDIASLILRNTTPSSFGLTLAPPTLSSNYTITLPALPIGGLKILRMDTSGNMSATLDVDNSTLEISSSTLRVKALGIGTAQLADASVTAAKLAADVPLMQQQTFSSNGTFTVPAGCTYLEFTLVGAGGGGGGGAGRGSNPGVVAVGGGGGGGGGAGQFKTISVAPTSGEIFTITVGTGGSPGTAGVPDGNGGAGTMGTASSAFRTTPALGPYLIAYGGTPGNPGQVNVLQGNQSGGNGSTTLSPATASATQAIGGIADTSGQTGGSAVYQPQGGAGGSGGRIGVWASGAGGTDFQGNGAGTSGGSSNAGGGGGAGGAGYAGPGGAGGAGGIFSSTDAQQGSPGATVGSGGGGGGGGSDGSPSNSGAQGGAGANGIVIVSYIAPM